MTIDHIGCNGQVLEKFVSNVQSSREQLSRVITDLKTLTTSNALNARGCAKEWGLCLCEGVDLMIIRALCSVQHCACCREYIFVELQWCMCNTWYIVVPSVVYLVHRSALAVYLVWLEQCVAVPISCYLVTDPPFTHPHNSHHLYHCPFHNCPAPFQCL